MKSLENERGMGKPSGVRACSLRTELSCGD